MNLINVVGILFAIAVMLVSMIWGNPSPMKLVDPHAMIVVLVGTAACVGVAFQLNKASRMILIFFRNMLGSKKADARQVIAELMKFADAYRNQGAQLDGLLQGTKDPFLREAMTALKDEVLEPKQLVRVLRTRVETTFERYNDEAKMFAACGKYPPAMGLMGAVLGMIALLGTLGTPGAEKNIGPAMSVALVATLYGIAFANLFVIPIGENLQESAKALRAKNTIIVEGVRLIAAHTNPIVLAEELNSFLLPSERLDWKKLSGA